MNMCTTQLHSRSTHSTMRVNLSNMQKINYKFLCAGRVWVSLRMRVRACFLHFSGGVTTHYKSPSIVVAARRKPL